MKGTVKWFEPEKGYGFIETDEREEDVFVHFSALNQEGFRCLEKGDRVRFQVVEGRLGPKARSVDKMPPKDLIDELTGTTEEDKEDDNPLVTIVTAKRNVYPWQQGTTFKARLLYTPNAPGDMYKFRVVVEDGDPFSSPKKQYDGYILKLNPSSPVFAGYYMEEDNA